MWPVGSLMSQAIVGSSNLGGRNAEFGRDRFLGQLPAKAECLEFKLISYHLMESAGRKSAKGLKKTY